jgi:hypothetical protein
LILVHQNDLKTPKNINLKKKNKKKLNFFKNTFKTQKKKQKNKRTQHDT